MINGIATEPILLPKFERNPLSSTANECLSDVATLYESSLRVLPELLEKKSRIAIIAPVIIDDRGREHRARVKPNVEKTGVFGILSQRARAQEWYPIRVPTSKRKIIQRNVYVMTVG